MSSKGKLSDLLHRVLQIIVQVIERNPGEIWYINAKLLKKNLMNQYCGLTFLSRLLDEKWQIKIQTLSDEGGKLLKIIVSSLKSLKT
jgi:hypothetical protein